MPMLLTPTANGRMPYFTALDGVRAYCILLVMFDHLKSDGHTLPGLNGHLGVDLFFIISGFLITTLLSREQFLTGRIDLRAFYWRRFFRIAPVYLVVFLLYLAVCHLPSQAAKWIQFRAGIPWFLTMMNEYVREPNQGSVFTHTWSLGVEEKFYLLWPVLAFVFAKTLRARGALIAGLFLLVSIPPLLGHGYLARAYFGLLMGCLMSFALSSSYADDIVRQVGRVPSFAILIVFLLGFYAEHVSKNFMFFFSSAAVLLFTYLITQQTWLSRLHELPPITWLGRRSYSMYLVHILCLNALESHIRITSGVRAAAVFVLAVALTAVVAEVLYRTVEQPARRFGRAYLARHNERSLAM